MNWTIANIPSQQGRSVVITGTGGLGYEAALALTRAGAAVILAGRNPAKGSEAIATIAAKVAGARISFEELDLADLRSVADFADRLDRQNAHVDLLINNAGVMSPPQRRTTADGFELQFGVNYLGHFALTARLMPLLRRSADPHIVSVTSLAQNHGTIAFDDLQSARRYRPGAAYCQSKLAQAMFAFELQRRSDRAGWSLVSNAAHPGYAGTSLFENASGSKSLLSVLSKFVFVPLIGQAASSGALPILYAASSPDALGGALYGPKGFLEMKGPPGMAKFAPAALDNEAACRLWEISEELVQLRFDLPSSPETPAAA